MRHSMTGADDCTRTGRAQQPIHLLPVQPHMLSGRPGDGCASATAAAAAVWTEPFLIRAQLASATDSTKRALDDTDPEPA